MCSYFETSESLYLYATGKIQENHVWLIINCTIIQNDGLIIFAKLQNCMIISFFFIHKGMILFALDTLSVPENKKCRYIIFNLNLYGARVKIFFCRYFSYLSLIFLLLFAIYVSYGLLSKTLDTCMWILVLLC